MSMPSSLKSRHRQPPRGGFSSSPPPPSHYVTGLFDVTLDRSIAIDTVLCYCCQVGRQFSAIEGYPNTRNWLMASVACSFAEFVPCCLRCKVNDLYGIQEPLHHSCAKGFFCGLCSVCQTGRELRARGVNPGGTCVPKRMGDGDEEAANANAPHNYGDEVDVAEHGEGSGEFAAAAGEEYCAEEGRPYYHLDPTTDHTRRGDDDFDAVGGGEDNGGGDYSYAVASNLNTYGAGVNRRN